jgi:hypothetical protein
VHAPVATVAKIKKNTCSESSDFKREAPFLQPCEEKKGASVGSVKAKALVSRFPTLRMSGWE